MLDEKNGLYIGWQPCQFAFLYANENVTKLFIATNPRESIGLFREYVLIWKLAFHHLNINIGVDDSNRAPPTNMTCNRMANFGHFHNHGLA